MFLSATANGIAIFMVFGAGLVAGLLGQIGEALDSDTLQTVADRTSWALPFEALYQDALYRITAESRGLHGSRDPARALRRRAGRRRPSAALGGRLFRDHAAVTLAAFSRKDL